MFSDKKLDKTKAHFGFTCYQLHPADGDRVSPWNVEVLTHLTWLSAWEHFIEFCHREIFKS